MPGAGKKTVAEFLKMKQRGEKIVMMTAYDAPTAAIAAEAGVEVHPVVVHVREDGIHYGGELPFRQRRS